MVQQQFQIRLVFLDERGARDGWGQRSRLPQLPFHCGRFTAEMRGGMPASWVSGTRQAVRLTPFPAHRVWKLCRMPSVCDPHCERKLRKHPQVSRRDSFKHIFTIFKWHYFDMMWCFHAFLSKSHLDVTYKHVLPLKSAEAIWGKVTSAPVRFYWSYMRLQHPDSRSTPPGPGLEPC